MYHHSMYSCVVVILAERLKEYKYTKEKEESEHPLHQFCVSVQYKNAINIANIRIAHNQSVRFGYAGIGREFIHASFITCSFLFRFRYSSSV